MDGKPSQGSDLGLNFAATLPLKSLPRFTATELLTTVNEILARTGAGAELIPELTAFQEEDLTGRIWHRPKAPPRVGLTLNGVSISIQGYDRPWLDAGELDGLDDHGWAGGRAKLARAHARLEITEVEVANGLDFDQNYDRAVAMTVVAYAAARLSQAIGLVWRSSFRAVPDDTLAPLVAELVEGRAPAQLWLGRAPLPETAGRLMTRGLYPLLGGEIEVASTALTAEAAFEVALQLAVEILSSGESPADNELIDYDAGTAFRVGYRQGGADGEIPAIVLTHMPRHGGAERAAGAA